MRPRALLVILLLPLIATLLEAESTAPCSDPLGIIRSFYAATDAGRFTEALALFAPQATFDTWATGVNGYIMAKRHLEGRDRIASYIRMARGLRSRLPDSAPDGPIFHETRLRVTGTTVTFMLEPDRKRPNGRQYNPFSVEAVIEGCRIIRLTVIERVTWL